MRPASFEPKQIIEAGLALQAEEKSITGFALRGRVGGGNPSRLKQIWDEYLSSQTEVTAEPVAELPYELAEEVKAVSSTLAERISHLARELNDKAVKAAERRVVDVTRAAAEQTAQAERELADAAQTVDDLEDRLDTLAVDHRKALGLLDASREREHERTINLTEVRERLAAAEKYIADSENQHQKQIEDLKNRLDRAEQIFAESQEQHSADLSEARSQYISETNELKSRNARAESDLQKRIDVAEQSLNELTTRHSKEMQEVMEKLTLVREEKATMLGEIKALKSYNDQFTELLSIHNSTGREESK